MGRDPSRIRFDVAQKESDTTIGEAVSREAKHSVIPTVRLCCRPFTLSQTAQFLRWSRTQD